MIPGGLAAVVVVVKQQPNALAALAVAATAVAIESRGLAALRIPVAAAAAVVQTSLQHMIPALVALASSSFSTKKRSARLTNSLPQESQPAQRPSGHRL